MSIDNFIVINKSVDCEEEFTIKATNHEQAVELYLDLYDEYDETDGNCDSEFSVKREDESEYTNYLVEYEVMINKKITKS